MSSAETREVAALAALWIRVVQDSLPVVWAIAGDAAASATARTRARGRLHGRSPARSSAAALQARWSA